MRAETDSRADRFTPKPVLSTALGLGASLLALLAAGLLTRAFVVAVVLGGFAVNGLMQLGTLRLRLLCSTVLGAAVFVTGLAGLIRWGDEAHFALMRPIYAAEVAALPQSARPSWFRRWDGGLGWDVSLGYVSDAAAGDTEDDAEAGCSVRRRHMAGHFYLATLECNAVPTFKQAES